jgi:hypothetical protein
MNIDTGNVITEKDLMALAEDERDNYVRLPRAMNAAATQAMVSGDSLFSGKHGGQAAATRARQLAEKGKAKRRRKLAQRSKRRNRQ